MSYQTVNIAFIGDVALLSSAPAPEVSDIKKVFTDCDIVFANLECSLKGNGNPNPPDKDAILITSEEHLQVLKELNINVVNLGNNHIFDYGLEGYEATVNFLKRENISYLGTGRNDFEASQALKLLIHGIKISFLSYVTYDTHPEISSDKTYGVNMFNFEQIIDDIKMLHNNGDLVVVSLHWGAERYNYPTPGQIKAARTMIDAGADLIIGHHSHVLQGMECHNGKYIFYNLGNFYFPDIYNKGNLIVKQKSENFDSIILKLQMSKKRIVSCEMIPITYNLNGQIELAPKENINNIMKYSKLIQNRYYSLYWKLYRIYIELFKYHWVFLLLRGDTYKYEDKNIWGYITRIRWRHFKALIKDIFKLTKAKCDI